MNSIVGISIINILTNKINEFFGLLTIVSILIAIFFQFTHKKTFFFQDLNIIYMRQHQKDLLIVWARKHFQNSYIFCLHLAYRSNKCKRLH